MSNRYTSFSSSRSSAQSDPSSSTELKSKPHSSSLKRLVTGSSNSHRNAPDVPQLSKALSKTKKDQSLSTMVKKLMDKKPKGGVGRGNRGELFVAAENLREDLKKSGKKGGTFGGGLGKKLFGKGSEGEKVKALTEVKANTRSLGMVLRSERELLSQNKDLELEIVELKLLVDERNREVEKLKDLCLKQREEIKSLKTAILFPDVLGSQLQDLLEKQGSELKQAKQLIPSLQRQVTSLTGQLHFLAEDLKEVKADKYSSREWYDEDDSPPRTPMNNQEAAANSLEFSSPTQTISGSLDDMLIKDLNPCLTPYYATKSKEFELNDHNSPQDNGFSDFSMRTCDDLEFDNNGRKLSRSSDYRRCSNSKNTSSQGTRKSDETKLRYGKQMQHRLF
ncbi:Thyroid receptor-interacting protein like [Heracleum sosnowskyi]|uniref:Thyroid receptor-interacting protein like n=1 Tax=Heracleum sosnowskyi TaxID=360622 RepID=A0AAD8JHD3_9APIA|nr:Thyroid receptor-interacting protein like [Heracleum sosnowskyi]